MTTVPLMGVRARPLSSYLVALGILRLVALQADPHARGRWAAGVFELDSRLGRDGIVEFFLHEYSPSPLVAPWNGADSGGFRPGADSRASRLVGAIAASSAGRLAPYRGTIASARAVVASPSWQEASSAGDKRRMVLALRNRLSDPAVMFLDAAVALTADDIAFPPVLGTGGNIGRLDLVTNYMEHLRLTLAEDQAGRALAEAWFLELVDGAPAAGVKDASPGQFDPLGVGGPNQSRGAPAPSQANPFAFVLAIEGALMLAATATRRLGSSEGRASAPFTVSSDPLGFGSAAAGEDGKGELWAPLWDRSFLFSELESLMAEGRATWQGQQARSATDFLRAVRTLGTDRGVTAFERYSFLVRNGQSPVAVPVGRIEVKEIPEVALTADLDPWLARVRRARDDKVPGAVRVARHKLERALFDVAAHPTPAGFRDLLVAVAGAERAVQRSSSFRRTTGVGPVPPLPVQSWGRALQDGSLECNLAWSLAVGWDGRIDGDQRALRDLLRGVRSRSPASLEGFREDGPVVSGLGVRPVATLLANVAVYRGQAAGSPPEEDAPAVRGVRPQFFVPGPARAPGWAAATLAAGQVDLHALDDWLTALLFVSPGDVVVRWERDDHQQILGAVAPLWRLLAPWWGQEPLRLENGHHFVPVVRPTWAARLRSGQPSQLRSVATEAGRLFGAAAGPSATSPELVAPPAGEQGISLLLAALMVPTRSRDLAGLVRRNVFLAEPENHPEEGPP